MSGDFLPCSVCGKDDFDETDLEGLEIHGVCYTCRHCEECEGQISPGETYCDDCWRYFEGRD